MKFKRSTWVVKFPCWGLAPALLAGITLQEFEQLHHSTYKLTIWLLCFWLVLETVKVPVGHDSQGVFK
jgi:hypothetical protein